MTISAEMMRKTTKTKRPSKPAPTIQECLDYATEALLVPPRHRHVERVAGRGELLATFVVQPLALMPSGNPYSRLKGWQKDELKARLKAIMAPQLARLRSLGLPLSGRPMVRAIRFSSTEGDADSGWTKLVIDRLTVRSGGLGIVVDDKPSKFKLAAWWEHAPPGRGFGYFELWSGAL